MKRLLNILLIEDSDDDEELLLIELRSAGYEVNYNRVQTAQEMANALQGDPDRDLILSDYSLPTFNAPLALTVLKQSGLDIPFIIISGTIGEERAVSTMRGGARDFILKTDLTRLIPVIERELRESEGRKLKRKVEQAYKNSEQRYRTIVDAAKEGIWLLDYQGRTTFVNKYLAQLLGTHEQNVLGREFVEFVDEESRVEAIKYIEEQKHNSGDSHDFRLKKSDDQRVDVIVSLTSMMKESHGPQGFLIMVTDVTERKQIERERTLLMEDLKDAVKIRDEFLSIASHELKTPLTSLKLQAQMRQKALSRGDYASFTPERLQYLFDGDVRQIQRLTRLIDDMLDISRINIGKLTIHREKFDLCDLIREVIERHSGQIDALGCKVTLDLCLCAIGSWDRFRIEQVLTNLLINALKYGAGKPVTIKVQLESESKVRFAVRDGGIGVAKENQTRIFQQFERAISPNEISGLGLGLYITKQIVELHGGQIWLESELGKGATFTVELPLFYSSEVKGN